MTGKRRPPNSKYIGCSDKRKTIRRNFCKCTDLVVLYIQSPKTREIFVDNPPDFYPETPMDRRCIGINGTPKIKYRVFWHPRLFSEVDIKVCIKKNTFI